MTFVYEKEQEQENVSFDVYELELELGQFEIHKVFLATSSRKNIFTVIAKDHIDLNATSSTASSHYHGTCMSLLQFPTTDNKGVAVDYDYVNCDETTLKVDKLLNEYAVSERRNLSFPNEFYLMVSTLNTIDIQDEILINVINEEKDWLQSYKYENDCCSSFHASKHKCSIKLNDATNQRKSTYPRYTDVVFN